MAKITFDKQHNVDVPTLLLQNRNFDTLGKINGACSLEYKENFNSADELSFTVYKTANGNKNALWDLIIDNKIVFIPEFQERFVISVSVNEENAVSKTITGVSLCESELSQINLYDIEINTEGDNGDIARNGATTFYNDSDTEHSLLHRLFEKAPHYSIAYVQDSLKEIKDPKSFSISDTDLYSELTGEIAQEFNCIFIFNSMDRTVSVYDLYNTCNSCSPGFRGDFSDKCPECGSTSFDGQYGEDTTVFISGENLASQINLEPDMDSYKNCFYVEGGDDVITNALRSVNPNGTNYIYYFSDNILNDMPDSLVDILNEYNKKYEECNSSMQFVLDTSNVFNYNKVVNVVKDKFKDDENIVKRFTFLPENGILTGYPSTTSFMYEAIDLYGFLKSSMMPTINTDGEGLEVSLKNIINGFADGFIDKDGNVTFRNEIAIRNNTSAPVTSVERVIEKASKLFFNTAYYSFEINTSSYKQATSEVPKGEWTGTFKLTSLTEYDDNGNKKSCESEQINLSVSSNAELFTRLEIYRAVTDSKKLKEQYKNLLSLKTDNDTFEKQLCLYALDELVNLNDIFKSCKDVLTKTKDSSDMDDDLLDKYSNFFDNRIKYIDDEINSRNEQLKCILTIYKCQNDDSVNGILNKLREKVNDELNIENFIKKSSDNGIKLWNTFCAYRREDKYSNSNYISDGQTDSEIVKKAEELLNVAKKELYKAGNIQYSISSTMNNLLALKEFYPLKDKFSVGNWIRVSINDIVYKLRLLSYKINFDDIGSIDVEFSTVEKIHSGYSDVESVLKSASSIAGSYSGLVQQVSKTTSTTDRINNLVSNGLNATKTKFIDSDNEEIVSDNHGILGRRYDYVTDSYDRHQFKILSNGIYLTSDNWETIHTGIGKISYFDPKKKEPVDDYGIIARTVVGNLFIGEELRIYGKNNSITLDEYGITLDGGAITWKSKIPKTEIEGLSKDLNDFANFQNRVNNSLFSTDISEDYVISPKIGGGYLYISKKGCGSVSIDPYQSKIKDGYIFAVKNSDDSVVMGVNTSGNAFFSGELCAATGSFSGKLLSATGDFSGDIKIGHTTNGGSISPYNCIIDSQGLRIGVGNGGTTYSFKVKSNGDVTTSGSITSNGYLNLANNTLIYNRTNGLVLNGSNSTTVTIKRSTIYNTKLYFTNDDNDIIGWFDKEADDDLELFCMNNFDIVVSSATFGCYNDKKITIDSENRIIKSVSGGLQLGNENCTVGLYGDTLRTPNEQNGTVSLGTANARWKELYISASNINTSDRNYKKEINLLNEKYEQFFMKLVPVSFLFKDGDSGRTHIGFISQDVENAMFECGLTDLDFAGFCKDVKQEKYLDENGNESYKDVIDENGNPVYIYSLRYEEFIPLNTYMLQKCVNKINDLENKIMNLQGSNI